MSSAGDEPTEFAPVTGNELPIAPSTPSDHLRLLLASRLQQIRGLLSTLFGVHSRRVPFSTEKSDARRSEPA
jgi:hypothetical protein